MTVHKILLSNLGYARGISGKLLHHIIYAHRHFYCSPDIQRKTLRLLSELVAQEDPDICCFVEIDQGSFTSAGLNQIRELINEKYPYFDIENKYARTSRLRSFFITKGKSNAFVAKHNFPHEKIHFRHGTKRLVYKIGLHKDLTLFFAHFSLNRAIRAKQITEVGELMRGVKGEVIFLGDFNILTGLNELKSLLGDRQFVLLNKENLPTFLFHTKKLVLDLCICSPVIAKQAHLKIIQQPYSDHAALLLEVKS